MPKVTKASSQDFGSTTKLMFRCLLVGNTIKCGKKTKRVTRGQRVKLMNWYLNTYPAGARECINDLTGKNPNLKNKFKKFEIKLAEVETHQDFMSFPHCR